MDVLAIGARVSELGCPHQLAGRLLEIRNRARPDGRAQRRTQRARFRNSGDADGSCQHVCQHLCEARALRQPSGQPQRVGSGSAGDALELLEVRS